MGMPPTDKFYPGEVAPKLQLLPRELVHHLDLNQLVAARCA